MKNDLLVKVGGSLFDLPDLGRHLKHWLASQAACRIMMVAGGAAAADLVRDAARLDGLGDEECHWLALRALSFTAHLLAVRLGDVDVITHIDQRLHTWAAQRIAIMDMHAFAVADEACADHLSHSWAVTSDSLALRLAIQCEIPDLILLKSRDVPGDWQSAASAGMVDEAFPALAGTAPKRVRIVALNFRRWLADRSSGATPQEPEP